MSGAGKPCQRITAATLGEFKHRGKKITCVTAYDYPTARVVDDAGVDVILVGDSLGMVILGYENTIPVTLSDMIHHAAAVVRGAKTALVVVDMPFLTCRLGPVEALRGAGRILQETGAAAVKVEGGAEMAGVISALVEAGIPVMGHVGLTPQSVNVLGGYGVRGKALEEARRIVEGALALERAGVFSLVLENVPEQLAALVSRRLAIPTIGIGASAACDGQVLVFHDLLGIPGDFKPRFVKGYASIGKAMGEAVKAFRQEVETGLFPGPEHVYRGEDDVFTRLEREFAEAVLEVEAGGGTDTGRGLAGYRAGGQDRGSGKG
ncbi:MAG: 3-methyl-2-oxobutanoate hydroxymethyltransferase [Firmicutes bacterium]|nr:3-methyl-2-oxobutanoate hydroxymethyltransferase [Bacillota bacterium]